MAILKFLHILFIFLWTGTLLTQTRLLGDLEKKRAAGQEMVYAIKRIYCWIDLPAMVLAITFGMLLLNFKDDLNWKAPWLHMKLTFAFFLILCDCLIGIKIVRHAKGLTQICHTFSGNAHFLQVDHDPHRGEAQIAKKRGKTGLNPTNFLSYKILYYAALTLLIAILISIYVFKPLWSG